MEKELQSVTEPDQSLQVEPTDVTPSLGTRAYNDMVYDHYITMVAVGGVVVVEDGLSVPKPMSMESFCRQWKVNRMALWRRRQADENFREKVAARRHEVFSVDRVAKAWNGIYMKTLAGNPEAGKLFFTNFDPDFKMPTNIQQHEVGNSLTGLLEKARQRRQQVVEVVTEGEIAT